MLAIRFQRVGRKGHAEFRVIVQEARRSPSSGAIVAQIGHYNPHSKVTVLDKEKASYYVGNGAQPSPRVAKLMKNEGIKLPDWVKIDTGMKKTIKNSGKLRRNRPAEEKTVEPAAKEAPVVEDSAIADKPAAEEPTVEAEVAAAPANDAEAPDATEEESEKSDTEAKTAA